jgi:hypothetical protein
LAETFVLNVTEMADNESKASTPAFTNIAHAAVNHTAAHTVEDNIAVNIVVNHNHTLLPARHSNMTSAMSVVATAAPKWPFGSQQTAPSTGDKPGSIDVTISSSTPSATAASTTAAARPTVHGTLPPEPKAIDTRISILGGKHPTITSISPTTAPAVGGIALTVVGTGFQNGGHVSVGDRSCKVEILVPHELRCIIEAGVGVALDVTYQKGSDEEAMQAVLPKAFSYEVPLIKAVIPLELKSSVVEQSITIRGSNFGPSDVETKVLIGEYQCIDPSTVSDSEIICNVKFEGKIQHDDNDNGKNGHTQGSVALHVEIGGLQAQIAPSLKGFHLVAGTDVPEAEAKQETIRQPKEQYQRDENPKSVVERLNASTSMLIKGLGLAAAIITFAALMFFCRRWWMRRKASKVDNQELESDDMHERLKMGKEGVEPPFEAFSKSRLGKMEGIQMTELNLDASPYENDEVAEIITPPTEPEPKSRRDKFRPSELAASAKNAIKGSLTNTPSGYDKLQHNDDDEEEFKRALATPPGRLGPGPSEVGGTDLAETLPGMSTSREDWDEVGLSTQSTPATKTLTVLNQHENGLRVRLDVEPIAGASPRAAVIRGTFHSTCPSAVTNFKCKVATPKYMTVEMAAPSGSTILSAQSDAITQSFTVTNTAQAKEMRIRLQIEYSTGGTSKSETINVSNLE